MRINGQSNSNWQSFTHHSESTHIQPSRGPNSQSSDSAHHGCDHGGGSSNSSWGQNGSINPWGDEQRQAANGDVNDLSDLYSNGNDQGQTNSSQSTDFTDSSASSNLTDSSNSANSTGNNGLTPDLQKAVDQINAWRQAAGLKPLTVDPKLNALAQEHSDDMQARNSMDHTGNGDLSEVMAAGYHGAAQNVGPAGASVSGILQQMYDEKNNPGGEQGHYENIMGSYDKIGLAVSSDGRLSIDFAS